jgi:hypothetical protein
MKSLSKSNADDPKFTRTFWKGVIMILLASMGLAVALVTLALVSYYETIY